MGDNKIKAIIFDVDGVIFKTHNEHGNYLWSRSIKEDLGLTSKHFSVIFSEKWNSIIRGETDLNEHLQDIFQEKLFKDLAITPQQYIQYWLSHDHHVNQDILSLVESLEIPCYLGTNQEGLRTTHILNTVGTCLKDVLHLVKLALLSRSGNFFSIFKSHYRYFHSNFC